MNSRIAGTGTCTALSGSQILAARRTPSDMEIQTCSKIRTGSGNEVMVFIGKQSPEGSIQDNENRLSKAYCPIYMPAWAERQE
jgi:hypothetical protein